MESFFQSVKYDFGLKETRLRTDMGVMMWIWYVFVSYSLAMLERAKGGLMNNERYKLTMAKAAREVAELVVGQWLLEALEKEHKRLKGKLDSYKVFTDKDLSFESRII